SSSPDPDPGAAEALIVTIDERRTACREKLRASSALRQERDQLVEAAERLGREATDRVEGRGTRSERWSELRERAARAKERSLGLRDRISSIDRELRPLIEPLGLDEVDLNRDPGGALARLEGSALDYRKLAGKCRECESEVATLTPHCA